MKKNVSKNVGKVFRPKKQINRKTKINLVFDPEARREFLTGFHKRKLQRRKQAQEELKLKLKEEKKRIRDEARDYHKTLVVSYRPIPGLEPEDQEKEGEGTVLEFPEHSVKVTELNPIKIKEETQEEDGEEEETEDVKIPTHSKKEINKAVRKLAAKKAKKSKVIKTKGRAESCKNRKKSRQQKRRAGDKRSKHRGGRDANKQQQQQ